MDRATRDMDSRLRGNDDLGLRKHLIYPMPCATEGLRYFWRAL
jgi:hypothetical protein